MRARARGSVGSAPAAACAPAAYGRCSVCGDDAVEARVLEIDRRGGTARAETALGAVTIAVDLLETVEVGDRVMVHQGFAIGRIEG